MWVAPAAVHFGHDPGGGQVVCVELIHVRAIDGVDGARRRKYEAAWRFVPAYHARSPVRVREGTPCRMGLINRCASPA